MDLIFQAGRQRFAVQDELLTLPLGLFFGMILVRFTSTTLNPEIKRLVAKVVNIPVTDPWRQNGMRFSVLSDVVATQNFGRRRNPGAVAENALYFPGAA